MNFDRFVIGEAGTCHAAMWRPNRLPLALKYVSAAAEAGAYGALVFGGSGGSGGYSGDSSAATLGFFISHASSARCWLGSKSLVGGVVGGCVKHGGGVALPVEADQEFASRGGVLWG